MTLWSGEKLRKSCGRVRLTPTVALDGRAVRSSLVGSAVAPAVGGAMEDGWRVSTYLIDRATDLAREEVACPVPIPATDVSR